MPDPIGSSPSRNMLPQLGTDRTSLTNMTITFEDNTTARPVRGPHGAPSPTGEADMVVADRGPGLVTTTPGAQSAVSSAERARTVLAPMLQDIERTIPRPGDPRASIPSANTLGHTIEQQREEALHHGAIAVAAGAVSIGASSAATGISAARAAAARQAGTAHVAVEAGHHGLVGALHVAGAAGPLAIETGTAVAHHENVGGTIARTGAEVTAEHLTNRAVEGMGPLVSGAALTVRAAVNNLHNGEQRVQAARTDTGYLRQLASANEAQRRGSDDAGAALRMLDRGVSPQNVLRTYGDQLRTNRGFYDTFTEGLRERVNTPPSAH